MKKRIAFLCFILVFSLTSPVLAIEIIYQNKPVAMDVQPQIVDGRTLVPIRAINDVFNGETNWNGENQEITLNKGQTVINLKIGDKKAKVNGETVELDVAAQIISNKTFVPLSFVAKYLGHDVKWDEENKKVIIDGEERNSTIIPSYNLEDINIEKLYEISGSGDYSGYKRLMGYPGDGQCAIYYQGDANSYQVTYEDLNPKDLQEKISWQYQGKTYLHTRSQLYEFFSNIISLESLLGENSGIINQDWLAKTFTKTYEDWLQEKLYSQDATRIVGKYLDKKTNVNYQNRYNLLDY